MKNSRWFLATTWFSIIWILFFIPDKIVSVHDLYAVICPVICFVGSLVGEFVCESIEDNGKKLDKILEILKEKT